MSLLLLLTKQANFCPGFLSFPTLCTMNFFASWTLFLDRDGTINKRLVGDYVQHWDDFEFLPGVIDAMAGLSFLFGKICVVTNQQGIGKGLMTVQQLTDIHHHMVAEITRAGGRIDGIYSCPHLAGEACNCRKPLPGLALQAQKDYPEIDFERSIMVGDMSSDIRFGAYLGMITVQVGSETLLDIKADYQTQSLATLLDKKNQLRLLAQSRHNRS